MLNQNSDKTLKKILKKSEFFLTRLRFAPRFTPFKSAKSVQKKNTSA